MMDTGWAEKEQEDTGMQICRELMEKLDEFYASENKYVAMKQLRKVCRVTGNFMWRLQTAGTFCCGCRLERSMNRRKRRLIECGKPTALAFPCAGPLLSEAVMTGDAFISF